MHVITDENDNPIFDESVMSAIWLINDETNTLTVVPRKSDNFEISGNDLDVAILAPISSEMLTDEGKMTDKGYTYIYPWQRRFCASTGYYTC